MPSTVDLTHPFAGRWLVQNSPADRIPSHGTTLFATSYAIDFVPVDHAGRTAPFTWVSLVRSEPAERFPGFGRPITAPVDGTVVAVHDTEVDHAAHRGVPSVAHALTQGRRAAGGWPALAGNHVLIMAEGVVVALCHLRQGSVTVKTGQQVRRGDPLGQCGNSGNSTEPHLHLQAMDGPDPVHARPLPITFAGQLPHSGSIIDVGDTARQ